MADRGPHPDRVPPRAVDGHGWVGERAGEHHHAGATVGRAVPGAAGAGRVDEQDRPVGAGGTGRERLGAVDDPAVALPPYGRAEALRLTGLGRLRLTAPRHPLLAVAHHTVE